MTLHGSRRDSENTCRLFDAQAAKEPQLHQAGLLRIQFGEPVQSVIERHDFGGLPLLRKEFLFEKDPARMPTALRRMTPATIVHQDPAHQLRRDADELLLVFPMSILLTDQAEIGLVHQRGWLQSVVSALPPEVIRGDTPQFRI